MLVLDVPEGFGVLPGNKLEPLQGDVITVICKASVYYYTPPELYYISKDGTTNGTLISAAGFKVLRSR